MSFDMQKILESKRALRCDLAARPVAEKLRLLDALREQALALRGPAIHSSALREEAAACPSTAASAKAARTKPK
jgi:hypothetical protein